MQIWVSVWRYYSIWTRSLQHCWPSIQHVTLSSMYCSTQSSGIHWSTWSVQVQVTSQCNVEQTNGQSIGVIIMTLIWQLSCPLSVRYKFFQSWAKSANLVTGTPSHEYLTFILSDLLIRYGLVPRRLQWWRQITSEMTLLFFLWSTIVYWKGGHSSKQTFSNGLQ